MNAVQQTRFFDHDQYDLEAPFRRDRSGAKLSASDTAGHMLQQLSAGIGLNSSSA
jgi:hypothetical protein